MADDDRTTDRDGRAPVRIGDAERERMTDLLQQHVAAGRLDMPEYERRVEHATSAVYEQDLDGLLDDLPPLDADGQPRDRRDDGPRGDREGWDDAWWPPRPGGRRRPPWGRGVPSPLLLVGGVLLVVLTHGWILLPLLFLAVARGGRGWGCGPRRPGHDHGRGWDDRAGRDRDVRRDPAPEAGGGGGGGPRWPGRFDPFADERR